MGANRKVIVVAVIIAAVVGLLVGKESLRKNKQKKLWMDQVVADFYDPEAAQFRNLKQNYRALCGDVNGKNRMGAYVGFKRFYSSSTGFRIEPDDDDAVDPTTLEGRVAGSNQRTFNALYDANCADY